MHKHGSGTNQGRCGGKEGPSIEFDEAGETVRVAFCSRGAKPLALERDDDSWVEIEPGGVEARLAAITLDDDEELERKNLCAVLLSC